MARTPPKLGEKGYERVAFDNYRTPWWVTDELFDAVEINGRIWEPAAGAGDMVDAMRARGKKVFASDIRVLPGLDLAPMNFEASLEWPGMLHRGDIPWPDWIITNPPFAKADRFIERALALTRARGGGVAMLLLNEFDAPQYHWPFFKYPAFRAKVKLSHRITWIGMETNAAGKKVGPRQVHAWWVWHWGDIDIRKPSYPSRTIFP